MLLSALYYTRQTGILFLTSIILHGQISMQVSFANTSTTVTSFTSSATGIYNFDKLYIDDPGYIFDNPYNTTLHPYNIVPPNPSLASYCGSVWSQQGKQFLTTAAWQTFSGTFWSEAWVEASTATGSSISSTLFTGLYQYLNIGDTIPAPTSAPCCLNCTVFGGNVQVFYWPTPAPSPPVTSLVNSAGFTFVSPSVYVAFEQLNATDLCGQVGQNHYQTTLAFPPDGLSTSIASKFSSTMMNDVFQSWAGTYNWSSFNYADLQHDCTYVTSTFYSFDGSDDTTVYTDPNAANSVMNAGGANGDPYDGFVYSYNPCYPTLSVPPQIFSIDPRWMSCLDGISAFYDPPYVLQPGSGLVPATSDPGKVSSITTSATAGATAVPATAPATTSPTVTAMILSTQTYLVPSTSQEALSAASTASSALDPPLPLKSASSSISLSSDPANNAQPTSVSGNGGSQSEPSNSDQPAAPPGNSQSQSMPANNGQPATASGNVGSQLSSAVDPGNSIYGVHTISPAAPGDPIVTIGSSTISMDANSGYIFGSKTLAPGGPALTLSGTTISLGPSGNNIIVNGVTSSLSGLQAQPVITVGSLAITPAASSGYLVGSQALVPGGPALTISGTTISLPATGNDILVNGVTSTLTGPQTEPVIAVGSLTLTAAAGSGYSIAGQTLAPGGQALTISGTTISLLPSGAFVINGVTVSSSSPTNPAVVITGSLGVGIQTLTPGEVITIGSDVLSLAPSGTAVIVVSGTETETVGVGGYVASGFGIAAPPTRSGGTAASGTPTSIAFSHGAAPSIGVDLWIASSMLGACILVTILL
ncbi:hypothetical protein MMC18_006640 [Xylographa bjoerkii]|nr:hypothetical protein [Xylographa bjoerkii]